MTSANGNIDSGKHIEILEKKLWTVIVRHFLHGNYVFQDDIMPPSIDHDYSASTWRKII
jgi:hypothetical protein